jgi:parvulin-like peptidyl-prolyl isomerase
MKTSRLLLLPAAAIALVAAGCGGSTPDVPANAVAVVDGTPVTKADLDALMARAKATYKAQSRDFPKAGTGEYQSLQQQAVAYLVKNEEYAKQAEELGVTVSAKQIDERIAEIKKTNYDNDQKKFDAAVEEAGFTTETLREELEANLTRDGVYAAVTEDVAVSDAEAKKHYAENKASYTTPESRDVRHILVGLKKKALALEIRKQILAGADFAALAKKYSTDPGSKDTGGKYTVQKGQMVPPFEKASFTLKTNEVSQPVKTQYGWHVIQPTGDLKKASVTPFAQVSEQIKAQLLDQQKSDAITTWDEELGEQYDGKVAYADGYAPPEVATTPTTTADES